MLLGAGILGVQVLGELPENNGLAQGVTLDIAAVLIAGVASAETVPLRMTGGSAFTSKAHTAQGATIAVGTSIISGTVKIGHEVTVVQSDGTSYVVTIFGATDAELADDEFMRGVVLDDWDWWLIKQREAA
ncbi:MAG: hypothetical protein Q8M31_05450 [Beijerinckiaceae bacterium]|nr:hypothetical protein [Beijerinckiaceae bacterium]